MGLYFCLFDFKPQLSKTNGYFEIYLFLFVVSESLIWSYSQIVKKKKKKEFIMKIHGSQSNKTGKPIKAGVGLKACIPILYSVLRV